MGELLSEWCVATAACGSGSANSIWALIRALIELEDQPGPVVWEQRSSNFILSDVNMGLARSSVASHINICKNTHTHAHTYKLRFAHAKPFFKPQTNMEVFVTSNKLSHRFCARSSLSPVFHVLHSHLQGFCHTVYKTSGPGCLGNVNWPCGRLIHVDDCMIFNRISMS